MDIPFRLIISLLFFAFMAHRGYYNRKITHSQEATIDERTYDPSSRLAGLLALAGMLSILLYAVSPRLMAWASLPLPTWLRWSGFGLALLGFSLLQWSHLALGQNWSDTPRIKVEQALVTSGPYRWIRHPIYTAFLLILGASLLITANWFIGSAWIGAVALDIHGRIRYEEAKMMARFGEAYRGYMQKTGRLLPRW